VAAAAPASTGLAAVGRQTAIYAGGMLLTKALSFLLLPLYTHYLSPADYGVIQLIEMTFEIVAIVTGSRLAVGIFHFYHKAADDRGRRAVLSTAALMLSGSFAMVALASAAFAPAISHLVFGGHQHEWPIRIAAAAFAFQGLCIVPQAFLRARESPTTFVAVNVASLVLQAGFNVLFLVVLGFGLSSVFLSNLIASALIGLWLAGDLVRRVGLRFDPASARDLWRFGLPLVLTQVATFILTFGNRYFLKAAGTETDVGLYALACQFGLLPTSVAYMPFSLVWDPMRFRIARQPDRDPLFAQAFIYLNALLLSATVAVVLFVDDIFHVMAAPEFGAAARLVPVILVAYLLQAWSGVLDLGIMFREQTRYNTIANWLAAGVALAGYVLLIPRYLGMGAAVATVIAFAARTLLIFVMSQRLFPIRYDWWPVVRLLLYAAAPTGLGALLPPLPMAGSLAARGALLLGFGACLWWGRVLPDDHRRRLVALARGRGGASLAAVLARFRGETTA
jgi:O-antigen/teichoic acid export membrane protein